MGSGLEVQPDDLRNAASDKALGSNKLQPWMWDVNKFRTRSNPTCGVPTT